MRPTFSFSASAGKDSFVFLFNFLFCEPPRCTSKSRIDNRSRPPHWEKSQASAVEVSGW